jgi:cell division septal protein FtsQ
MPKPKLKSVSSRRGVDPDTLRWRRRVAVNCGILAALLLGGVIGYSHLRGYVEHRLAFTKTPPKVVLKNRPVWMSDFLAEQIVASVQPATGRSAFDQKMLVAVYEILKTNPWIRQVTQVRRAYGKAPGDTIEVDCEYRAPIALVRWGDYYSLVDAEGVKLPEQFTAAQVKKIMFGQDGHVNIRVIEGVKHAPPPPGIHWPGEDLAAGLEMVGLLYGKPYAEEILNVSVHNYAGRLDDKEAWLVLMTRDGTEVRWGRPKSASDGFIEVKWFQKLDYMQRIVEKYHRADAGHAAVDLRFDHVTFPVDESPGIGQPHGTERSATLRMEP